jgi:hypothetical protein
MGERDINNRPETGIVRTIFVGRQEEIKIKIKIMEKY